MLKVVVLLYFLRSGYGDTVQEDDGEYQVEIKEEPVDGDGIVKPWAGRLFQTVKKYRCRVDVEEDQDLLVYGSKSWTFPAQDVNLTFQYPSRQRSKDGFTRNTYLLTELDVMLYFTGFESRGYITNGGMLQGNINMMFKFRNITSLSYEISLYGVPTRLSNHSEKYTLLVQDLC